MNEDYLLLILGFLVYGLTLTILTVRSKNKLKTLSVNLIIVGLYSGLFTYNLIFNGNYGSGFLWLLYLTFSLGIHWVINLVGIVLTFNRTKKIEN